MRTMSAQELKNQMEINDRLVVINVLDQKYHNDCHITKSVNIPLDDLSEGIKEYPLDTPLVVYCANTTSSASAAAADVLEGLGYDDVAIFPGGMKEWYDVGYPHEGPAQEEYLKNKVT